MYEQRVEHLGGLLLVGELKGTLEGNPHAFQMHRPDLDDVLLPFRLEDAVTAATRHASHIEKLSAIDHVVV